MSINKSGTGEFYFNTVSGGRIKFNSVLSFSREGSEVFKLEQSYIQAKKTINLNGNKIINLGTPAEGTEAATKTYVDELVAANEYYGRSIIPSW